MPQLYQDLYLRQVYNPACIDSSSHSAVTLTYAKLFLE